MFARTAKLLTLECPHAVRAPVGKGSCRFISGASKRPERGKSPDARRAPGSFHDGAAASAGRDHASHLG